jgi:dynein heavy chain, axonemal
LDDILEKLPDPFLVRELMAKTEEKTPYTVVALQECERMNNLTIEIRRSLKELNLGLKVNFTYKNLSYYFLFFLIIFKINYKRVN